MDNKKLSIEEFRELTKYSKLDWEYETLKSIFKIDLLSEEEFESSKEKEVYEDYDDYLDQFEGVIIEFLIEKQRELLTYDLSDIPSEEWEGFTFYKDGDKLDLSNTKGNFDFNIINFSNISINENIEIIGHNCNIKNLFEIYRLRKNSYYYFSDFVLKKENFDENTIQNNDDAFYDDFTDNMKELFVIHSIISFDSFLKLSDEELDIIRNSNFFNKYLMVKITNQSRLYDREGITPFLTSKENLSLLIDLTKNNKDIISFMKNEGKSLVEELIQKSNNDRETFISELYSHEHERAIDFLFDIDRIYHSSEIVRISEYREFYDDTPSYLEFVLQRIISNIQGNEELVNKIKNKELTIEDFINYPDILSDPILIYCTKDLKEIVKRIKFYPNNPDNETTKEEALEKYKEFIEKIKNFSLQNDKEKKLLLYNLHSLLYPDGKSHIGILFGEQNTNYDDLSIDELKKTLNLFNEIKKKNLEDLYKTIINNLLGATYYSSSKFPIMLNSINDFLGEQINKDDIDIIISLKIIIYNNYYIKNNLSIDSIIKNGNYIINLVKSIKSLDLNDLKKDNDIINLLIECSHIYDFSDADTLKIFNKLVHFYDIIKDKNEDEIFINGIKPFILNHKNEDIELIFDYLNRHTNNNEIDSPITIHLLTKLYEKENIKDLLNNKIDDIIKLFNDFKSFGDKITINDDYLIDILLNTSLKYDTNNAEIKERINYLISLFKKIDKLDETDLSIVFNTFRNKYNSSLDIMGEDFDKFKDLECIIDYCEKITNNSSNKNEKLRIFSKYLSRRIEGDILNIEHLDSQYKLCIRIGTSNSLELQKITNELIDSLIEFGIDEAFEKLNYIEDIFIKNNLPYVAKAYKVYEVLHSNNHSYNYCRSRNLNTMKSRRSKDIIIFSDLFRCAAASNNKSLISYINNIEKGNIILQSIISGKLKIEDLNRPEFKKDKEAYEEYLMCLNTLYNNTKEGNEKPRKNKNNIIKDSYELLSLFLKQDRENFDASKLPDRIVKMFAHFAGFDTFEALKEYMTKVIKDRHELNTSVGNQGQITIKKGDLIKGIGNITHLSKMLQNGVLCKEFLGAGASSDATPFDTDLWEITSDKTSFFDLFKDSYDSSYGPIYIVLKNDNRINNSDESKKYIPGKLELFKTGVLGDRHYGIRTGFASSDIDCFVVEKYNPKIGLEIAKNGFYIPVTDEHGKVIFTPEMYDDLRKKMSGLSYYGIPNYEISKNLSFSKIEDTKHRVSDSIGTTSSYVSEVATSITDAINYGGITSVVDGFNPDLSPGIAELYSTGSTSRGTNVPLDSDFDYLIKIDREIFFDEQKLAELKNKMKEKLNFEDGFGGKICGKIKKGDTELDVEISFCPRTDKVDLSTDSSLSERLDAIKEQYPDSYMDVLANIVYAKELFKEVGAYKSLKSDSTQGGLGGIGIENWILQHGGSLYDAAKDFIEVSENCEDFVEFTKKYQVFDFGQNHYSDKANVYPHDNFVGDDNKMGKDGYERMCIALKKFINEYEIENGISKGNKQL